MTTVRPQPQDKATIVSLGNLHALGQIGREEKVE